MLAGSELACITCSNKTHSFFPLPTKVSNGADQQLKTGPDSRTASQPGQLQSHKDWLIQVRSHLITEEGSPLYLREPAHQSVSLEKETLKLLDPFPIKEHLFSVPFKDLKEFKGLEVGLFSPGRQVGLLPRILLYEFEHKRSSVTQSGTKKGMKERREGEAAQFYTNSQKGFVISRKTCELISILIPSFIAIMIIILIPSESGPHLHETMAGSKKLRREQTA